MDHDISARLDCRTIVQSVLPIFSGIIQNLEHGDRRRQPLHGFARWADDFAHRGAGRNLHNLGAGRDGASCSGHGFRIGRRNATHSHAGELLRLIDLPLASLRQCTAFRQISLSPFGRSAALLIGTLAAGYRGLHPDRNSVNAAPDPAFISQRTTEADLLEKLEDAIPEAHYYDDIHGSPAWRRHMTQHFAEEIRQELAGQSRHMILW